MTSWGHQPGWAEISVGWLEQHVVHLGQHSTRARPDGGVRLVA